MDLYRVPLTDNIWQQFNSWYQLRDVPKAQCPVRPDEGVWIAMENGTLVAGVCLYPSKAFLHAEFLSTNPAVPARLRALAVHLCAAGVRFHGSMSGKRPIISVGVAGIASILKDHGFREARGQALYTAECALETGQSYSVDGERKRVPDAEGGNDDAEDPVQPERERSIHDTTSATAVKPRRQRATRHVGDNLLKGQS